MPQVAVYLDKNTADDLARHARKAGISQSAFVRDAITEKLKAEPNAAGFPQWWFDLSGSWEDDRSPEEIMRDIREGSEQPDRAFFE